MQNLILIAQASNSGAYAIGGVFLVFMVLALLASIFWIWALIDCLTSSLPTNEKLLWALVIFFLHLLGAILYFAIGRKGRHATP